jgi:hypothetical protein
MRINKLVASTLMCALLGLETWTLKTVVELKVELAAVRAELQTHMNAHAQSPIAKR